MDTVTDYVAAGSFEDIRNNVTYLNEPGYAQLVRTVDLKKKFTNNDSVYVDESAFKYLWRVNLNDECIVLPNIGANIGEVYFVEPSGLPYDNNVLGPNAILLKANEDTYFAFTALNNLTFQKQLFENVGSSGQPKFNKTKLKSIQLYMPQNEEQVKIGQYFRQLDHLITLHQRNCDQMKELKKYMLTKMFPQNGAKVPEIRFDGFIDDWEQRKLDDVVEFLDTMRKPLEGAKRISGSYPYYGASGIVDYVDGYLFDEELILLSEDGANITDRNYPVCFLASGKYWVNNHAHVLRTKQGNENNFICNSLEQKDYTQYNTGMAMPKLNKETCKKIPVSCPEFKEQKKIGDYFRSLDHLITLHQSKCENLKNLKEYMLRNMFV